MPYTKRRNCPICFKPDLLSLSHHLSQVHGLSSDERKPWLKSALFSPTPSFPFQPSYPFLCIPQQYPGNMSKQQSNESSQSMSRKHPKTAKIHAADCLKTKAYPEFKFQHMFSMLVVGPSQCGKTYFVQQLLTKNCIEFPEKKPLQVYWFYNQWQPRYDEIKQVLKKKIRFAQGLPELSDDLHEINPEHNNVLVFDDLMAQAVDSPVLSRLFTQGRHRNASTILLLQNMFPKGKYNTDISRNASYDVLFRSPADRKQIDIVAERTFAKDRGNFMRAYAKETDKPFGYIVIDNRTQMRRENQVMANVFEGCYTYPYITKRESPQNKESTLEEKPRVKPNVTVSVKRKVTRSIPVAKKQKKETPAKRQKKRKKPAKKQKNPKRKPAKKQPRKPSTPKERFTGGVVEPPEESEEYEEPEESGSEEYEDYELSESYLGRQAYRMARSQGGFGPSFQYV